MKYLLSTSLELQLGLLGQKQFWDLGIPGRRAVILDD